MSTTNVEQLRKFIFKSSRADSTEDEKLEVVIPELLQASYSFYTWPSAPVLAWYLWENRKSLSDLHVLEIGSGTALPGIVASKCGAKVTLTDSVTLVKSLTHIARCCELNNLIPNKHINILGLTWGLFLENINSIEPVDLILGSDCFYEPSVFEDIIVTVSYILDKNINAKFICAYQERSSDWSIEHLLAKWMLKCKVIDTSELGQSINLDIRDLMGDHTIHLLEITKLYVGNLPWTVSHNELKNYFSKFGHVNSAVVAFDRKTGLSKNHGFVVFSTREGYERTINTFDHKLEGNNLKVQPSNNN